MEGERQQVAELEERWARLGRTAGEEVPGQESAQVKVCREQPQDTNGRWNRVSRRNIPPLLPPRLEGPYISRNAMSAWRCIGLRQALMINEAGNDCSDVI